MTHPNRERGEWPNPLVPRLLTRLYRYDWARAVKEHVRPLKHLIFGKDDIYYVIDMISRARGDVDPVRVVFDIGAAVGDKTITFLKHFRDAKVYCFEPRPDARRRLIRRAARWSDRVVLFDYGVYSANREIPLRLCSYGDASSILPLPEYQRKQGKYDETELRITVRRLDDCCRDLRVAKIDLTKVDVEGVEKEVLEDSAHTLLITDNLYVEIDPFRKPSSTHHIEVLTTLHSAGFKFMGNYGDYWFSKDSAVLRMYFEQGYLEK